MRRRILVFGLASFRRSNSHLLNSNTLIHDLKPSSVLVRFFGAQADLSSDEEGSVPDFNSAEFDILPSTSSSSDSGGDFVSKPTWNQEYRDKIENTLFGGEKAKKKKAKKIQTSDEDEERRDKLAKALLQAAILKPDYDGKVMMTSASDKDGAFLSKPTWNQEYSEKIEDTISGGENPKESDDDEELRKKVNELAKANLRAVLLKRDDEKATTSSSNTLGAFVLKPTWNQDKIEDTTVVEGEKVKKKKNKSYDDEERRKGANKLAKALLQAALLKPDDEEEEASAVRFGGRVVKEEDQKSLSVGIIGAPNAGKSALTNYMVGSKVSAVSRKTNTTRYEVLGVLTSGCTQICFFDTPGLMLTRGHPYPFKTDVTVRLESSWNSIELYDTLIVLFDAHRHLTSPDSRVTRLIKLMGEKVHPKQTRILCMNKVDLVASKEDLLKVARQFGDLPGYEKFFMISGLKGSGVKDLMKYLAEKAVKRPWDEEPSNMSEEFLKNLSLEVVREKLLNHVHQEIPYVLEHRVIDLKELDDGSLRIEHLFIAQKGNHRRIVVGKNGSKIGKIGIEATEELCSILKRKVHVILTLKMA